MIVVLIQLLLILAPLSLLAVGGVVTVVPELHRQVVEVRGWLTDAEFAELFALGQMAPGPNVLNVAGLIGWKMAGLPGALVAMLALCGPSSILAYVVAQAGGRIGHAPWLVAIRVGLAPVAVGLTIASGVIISSGIVTSPVAYVVAGVTTILVLRTHLHPLLLMAGAAGLALLGWI